jgi:hypothetical protein
MQHVLWLVILHVLRGQKTAIFFGGKIFLVTVIILGVLKVMHPLNNNTNKLYLILYLLTAIGLTPGGSSTVHIYTQTVHRTQCNRIHRIEHT